MLPRGLLRFLGARLLRALISLLAFQFILFWLIQALPERHAALSEGEALALALADSGPAAGTQGSGAASAESAGTARAQTERESDPFASLRESGRPEMIELLDEAAFLEREVQGASAPPAPEPPEPATAPEAEPALAADSQPDEVAAPSEPLTPAVTYEQGLAAIRPPEDNLLEKFLDWEARFLRGDLGESVVLGGGSVAEILAAKLPATLLLLLPGIGLGLLLGIWLGKRVAWNRKSWFDLAATLGGTAFYTSFPPWLAFMIIATFAVNLRWFPVEKLRNPVTWSQVDADFNAIVWRLLLTFALAGMGYAAIAWRTRNLSWARNPIRIAGALLLLLVAVAAWLISGQAPLVGDILHHMALPTATLILLSFGETMLIMRATMSDVMDEGHVAQVRAMGYAESRIRDRHVAPVAILPVLTRFIVHLPFVIVGSFFIEHAFGLDGMGKRLVEAANAIDLPVVMGVLSLVGLGILAAHVLFDVLSAWLDPRLRAAPDVGVD